jgi:hypothetical protein
LISGVVSELNRLLISVSAKPPANGLPPSSVLNLCANSGNFVFSQRLTFKFSYVFFNTIGAAAQLQKGKQYSSIEELFKDFLGKPVRVTVKNETSESYLPVALAFQILWNTMLFLYFWSMSFLIVNLASTYSRWNIRNGYYKI